MQYLLVLPFWILNDVHSICQTSVQRFHNPFETSFLTWLRNCTFAQKAQRAQAAGPLWIKSWPEHQNASRVLVRAVGSCRSKVAHCSDAHICSHYGPGSRARTRIGICRKDCNHDFFAAVFNVFVRRITARSSREPRIPALGISKGSEQKAEVIWSQLLITAISWTCFSFDGQPPDPYYGREAHSLLHETAGLLKKRSDGIENRPRADLNQFVLDQRCSTEAWFLSFFPSCFHGFSMVFHCKFYLSSTCARLLASWASGNGASSETSSARRETR